MRGPATGYYWLLATAVRGPATGYYWLLATAVRGPATGYYWLPATAVRGPATGYWLLATAVRGPATGYSNAQCVVLLLSCYYWLPLAAALSISHRPVKDSDQGENRFSLIYCFIIEKTLIETEYGFISFRRNEK